VTEGFAIKIESDNEYDVTACLEIAFMRSRLHIEQDYSHLFFIKYANEVKYKCLMRYSNTSP
jgi:hypothetical protein